MTALNLAGMKFGRLVAISPEGRDNQGLIKWKCVCDCGNTILVAGSNLKKGNNSSCGCLKKIHARNMGCNNKTHGHTIRIGKGYTSTYSTWSSMKQRCLNKTNNNYNNYGGRGITICDRWMRFEAFLDDMGIKPLGMTLERKDNSKGYCVDNCIWATQLDQNKNKRTVIKITYNNLTHTLFKWAQITNIPYYTLYDRLKKLKWNIDKALSTPPIIKHRRKNDTQK